MLTQLLRERRIIMEGEKETYVFDHVQATIGLIGLILMLLGTVFDPWLLGVEGQAPPRDTAIALCFQVPGMLCIIMSMAPLIERLHLVP
jgi:hypothetical protein